MKHNEDEYLAIGILEDFCLGMLPEDRAAEILAAADKYPAVKKRIECIEQGIQFTYRLKPSEQLKMKIFSQLQKLSADHTIDLTQPPPINQHSDADKWNRAVSALVPVGQFKGVKVYPLRFEAGNQLYVAWLSGSVEEAGHREDEFAESFLILEGTCDCDLAGNIRHLQPGDFLEIPFNIKHVIQCTSVNKNYVKAILQRRKTAKASFS